MLFALLTINATQCHLMKLLRTILSLYILLKSARSYEIFFRIAVMVHDYHEICSGPNEMLSGLPQLYLNLLEKSGYKILTIPFNEFSSSEKLLKRVQYLETKLKKIIVK